MGTCRLYCFEYAIATLHDSVAHRHRPRRYSNAGAVQFNCHHYVIVLHLAPLTYVLDNRCNTRDRLPRQHFVRESSEGASFLFF
jgi:hypothetical protein